LDISYTDGATNTTSSSKVQAQTNQSSCRFNTINSASGDDTIREIAILDGGCFDNTSGTNTTNLSTFVRAHTTSGANINDIATYNLNDTTASNAYQQTLSSSNSNLLLTTTDSIANYTTSVAINSTKNGVVSCSMISTDTANNKVAFNNSQANASTMEAKTEIKCVDTTATPLTSDIDLISDTTSARFQQTFISGAANNFSTYTTNSTGLQIVSNNSQLQLVAASNATLQGSSATIICSSSGILANASGSGGSTLPTTITNSFAGGQANPLFTLTNTNATGSVALEVYKDKGIAGTAGDVLFNQSIYGKNSANVKEEYARITSTIRNPAAPAAGADGDYVVNVAYNDVLTPMLTLNGNTGNILGAASASTNLTTTINTGNNVAGSGAGLILNGNTLTTAAAGVPAGLNLTLTINGVVYKIALLT
jgi:hypothetical protein